MVLPVTVMQSPCKYPPSKRRFIKNGMPPAACISAAMYLPNGLISVMRGTREQIVSKSSMCRSMFASRAKAKRWRTAFVEQPVAAIQRQARYIKPGERHHCAWIRFVTTRKTNDGIEMISARHEFNRIRDHL